MPGEFIFHKVDGLTKTASADYPLPVDANCIYLDASGILQEVSADYPLPVTIELGLTHYTSTEQIADWTEADLDDATVAAYVDMAAYTGGII